MPDPETPASAASETTTVPVALATEPVDTEPDAGRFRLTLPSGEEVEVPGTTLVDEGGENGRSPMVLLRLPACRAHDLAHMLDRMARIDAILNEADDVVFDESELAEALNRAATEAGGYDCPAGHGAGPLRQQSLEELRRQQGIPAGQSFEQLRGPGLDEAEFRAFFDAVTGDRRLDAGPDVAERSGRPG